MGEQPKREVHVCVCKQSLQNNYQYIAGQMRKRKDYDGSEELSTILAKFIEVTEECDTKRRLAEAEIEEKWREQERKHEKRMMIMMMGFMPRVMGFSPTIILPHRDLFLLHRTHSHHALIFHILVPPHPSLLTIPLPTHLLNMTIVASHSVQSI